MHNEIVFNNEFKFKIKTVFYVVYQVRINWKMEVLPYISPTANAKMRHANKGKKSQT